MSARAGATERVATGVDALEPTPGPLGFRNESGAWLNDSPCNAMTVDVEEHFQVSAFEEQFSADDWQHQPSRVVANTQRILEEFAAANVHATFFVLGWVAERAPQLVADIAAGGHEVASHGYRHARVTTQTPAEFAADVDRTRKLLQDTSGQPVHGYRAASYSIGADNLWALDELRRAGHRYSSSIYPIKHDLYGMPDAPRFGFRVTDDGILELPVSTVEWAGLRMPAGGGGFFRLFPYVLSRWAIRRVNRLDRQPAIFYFHPWEVDPAQPRVAGASGRSRFRHYLNLERMQPRLRRLLRDFRWDRMDRVFLSGDEAS